MQYSRLLGDNNIRQVLCYIRQTIRNQYNQIPHLTQDPTWENSKNTQKHYTQETQEVNPFPASDHKAGGTDKIVSHKTQQQK